MLYLYLTLTGENPDYMYIYNMFILGVPADNCGKNDKIWHWPTWAGKLILFLTQS
jgi:hypothetical protein